MQLSWLEHKSEYVIFYFSAGQQYISGTMILEVKPLWL